MKKKAMKKRIKEKEKALARALDRAAGLEKRLRMWRESELAFRVNEEMIAAREELEGKLFSGVFGLQGAFEVPVTKSDGGCDRIHDAAPHAGYGGVVRDYTSLAKIDFGKSTCKHVELETDPETGTIDWSKAK